jgi:hypothetical protein
MLIKEFKREDADIVLQNANKFTVAFELELAFDTREMNSISAGYGEEFFKKWEYDSWSIFEPAKELFAKFLPSLVPYIPHLTFAGDGSIKGISPSSHGMSGLGVEIAPKLYFKLLNGNGLSSFDFLEKFYNDYPKQKVFVLNKSTGFHVNIGFEGELGRRFDTALAFLTVNHKFSNVLAPDRENNRYARDIRTNPVDTERDSERKTQILYNEIQRFSEKEKTLKNSQKIDYIFDIIRTYLEASNSHYNGFSTEKLEEENYIEFRFPGGDFVTNNSLEKIKNTILYYCHIVNKGFFGELDASAIKKAFAFYEKLKEQLLGPANTGKIHKVTNTLPNGWKTISYLKDGKPHRRNGPADITVREDGKLQSEAYSIDGLLHRQGAPAIISYHKNGQPQRVKYYLNGKVEREEDEPCYIEYNENGNIVKATYFLNGYVGRSGDKPSEYYYSPSGELEGVKYIKRNALHRDVGPAVIKFRDGKPVLEKYYINDREATKEEQEKWATVRGLMEEKFTVKDLRKLVMETVDSVYDNKPQTQIVTIPQDRRLITESFLTMWGHSIRKALEKMFDIPVYENITFQGRRTDVEALYRTLGAEKRYIDSFINNGLSDPRVTNSKWELEKAIHSFESQTGIKWPII